MKMHKKLIWHSFSWKNVLNNYITMKCKNSMNIEAKIWNVAFDECKMQSVQFEEC